MQTVRAELGMAFARACAPSLPSFLLSEGREMRREILNKERDEKRNSDIQKGVNARVDRGTCVCVCVCVCVCGNQGETREARSRTVDRRGEKRGVGDTH